MKEFKKWAFDSFDNKGFQSYVDERKQKLLAAMASGVPQRDYYRLVGQLYEIGTMYVKLEEVFKKTMQNKKEQEAKTKPAKPKKVKIR